jgi:hypothetical protein
MVIDQRNNGSSYTSVGGGAHGYALDRWCGINSQASKYTIQQNAGSITPLAGFKNYLGVTSSSAYTVGASEIFGIWQFIEGYNVADLAWGTASAATVTLSFRVYSSLTGTFGGAIQNGSATRSYPFSYSVPTANTWTTISITIAGDTTGTWATDNTAGLNLIFNLGTGASLSGTSGAWAGTGYYAPTGAVSVVGTSGATFYITGVQLEQGSVATPFERPLYSKQLADCQRYLPAYNASSALQLGISYNYTSTSSTVVIPFKVSTRVAPTGITVSSQSILTAYTGGNPYTATAITLNGASTEVGTVSLTISGATAGQAGLVNFNAAGQLLFTGCEL